MARSESSNNLAPLGCWRCPDGTPLRGAPSGLPRRCAPRASPETSLRSASGDGDTGIRTQIGWSLRWISAPVNRHGQGATPLRLTLFSSSPSLEPPMMPGYTMSPGGCACGKERKEQRGLGVGQAFLVWAPATKREPGPGMRKAQAFLIFCARLRRRIFFLRHFQRCLPGFFQARELRFMESHLPRGAGGPHGPL